MSQLYTEESETEQSKVPKAIKDEGESGKDSDSSSLKRYIQEFNDNRTKEKEDSVTSENYQTKNLQTDGQLESFLDEDVDMLNTEENHSLDLTNIQPDKSLNESLLERYLTQQNQRLMMGNAKTFEIMQKPSTSSMLNKTETNTEANKNTKINKTLNKEHTFVIKPVAYPNEVIDEEAKIKLWNIVEAHIKANKIGSNEIHSKSIAGAILQKTKNRTYIIGLKKIIAQIDYEAKQMPKLCIVDQSKFKPSPVIKIYMPIEMRLEDAKKRIIMMKPEIKVDNMKLIKITRPKVGIFFIVTGSKTLEEQLRTQPYNTLKIDYGGVTETKIVIRLISDTDATGKKNRKNKGKINHKSNILKRKRDSKWQTRRQWHSSSSLEELQRTNNLILDRKLYLIKRKHHRIVLVPEFELNYKKNKTEITICIKNRNMEILIMCNKEHYELDIKWLNINTEQTKCHIILGKVYKDNRKRYYKSTCSNTQIQISIKTKTYTVKFNTLLINTNRIKQRIHSEKKERELRTHNYTKTNTSVHQQRPRKTHVKNCESNKRASKRTVKMTDKIYSFVLKPINYPQEVISNENKIALSSYLTAHMKASEIPENEITTKSACGVMFQKTGNRTYILGLKNLLGAIDYEAKGIPEISIIEESKFNPSATLRLYLPTKIDWAAALKHLVLMKPEMFQMTKKWKFLKAQSNFRVQGSAYIFIADTDTERLVAAQPRETLAFPFGGVIETNIQITILAASGQAGKKTLYKKKTKLTNKHFTFKECKRRVKVWLISASRMQSRRLLSSQGRINLMTEVRSPSTKQRLCKGKQKLNYIGKNELKRKNETKKNINKNLTL